MKFKPYPKYKASGVEWLGDVPEGWAISRLKWSISQSKGGVWGDEPTGDENDLVCIRVADFNRDQLKVSTTSLTYRQISISEQNGRRLELGDLLLEKSGGGENQPVGCVIQFDQKFPAVCSNFIARLTPSKTGFSDYFKFVHTSLYSLRLTTRSINQTSGIQNLDTDRYLSEQVGYPPVEEQSTIATFLDHETAKIDTLIAKQEKLIDLLKEKRQAVISHAVTKGLDPTVPMKPSGVEWLGDVPEHWIHRRIRFCASLNPSKSEISHLARNYEVSFLPMEAIGDDGKLRLDITKAISDVEYGYTYFRNGDITIAKITPCYENGKGGFMDGLTNGIGFGTTELIVVRPNSQTNGLFLKWLFESKLFRKIGEGYMYGAGGQKRVPDDFVRNFAISWPPLTEQQEIVAYLDKVTAKIDILIAKAQQAIALQKEHRTALISAAVTGKIDVRNIACKAVDKRSTQKFNKVQHANI